MQEASDFVLFLGRFHPLVVHLPIGFLLFAFILELWAKYIKNPALTSAVPIALLAGAISAVVACILGYMLSLSNDYDEHMIDDHFWFGIFTTLIAFFAWLVRSDKLKIKSLQKTKPNIALLTLIVILLGITGHYGGNLTHGSDYLTKYAPFNTVEKKELPQIAQIEEAGIYPYLVDPIVQNKCVSCHNSSKKKGGLAMHDSIAMLKGGKNGPIFTSGQSLKSDMIHRVTLAETHEDFMPPEGKTPLTDEEIKILTYWIDSTNASFHIKLGAFEAPEEIKAIAADQLGLQYSGSLVSNTLPVANAIDEAVLKDILNEGFQLRELTHGSNLFDVALPSKMITENNKEMLRIKLQKLVAIKDNVLRLNLSNNWVQDEHLSLIGEFNKIRQLQLQQNPIGDNGIKKLAKLDDLQSINLYGTNISKASLQLFEGMANLKKVYVWKTDVTKDDFEIYKDKEKYPKLVFGL